MAASPNSTIRSSTFTEWSTVLATSGTSLSSTSAYRDRTTTTFTTTVWQLLYYTGDALPPSPASAVSSALATSSALGNLKQVASVYEGMSFSELSTIAGSALLLILIALLMLICTLAQARRAQRLLADDEEESGDEGAVVRSVAERRPLVPEALNGAAAVIVGVARAKAIQNATGTTHGKDGSSTGTATAAWATQTTGGMTQASDDHDTIVVHSDAGVTYGCPRKTDTWQVESLTDSLSAHVASGPGCFMRYSFTGDSIQVYGASGLQAGVFGCSEASTAATAPPHGSQQQAGSLRRGVDRKYD
ncbi:hypothetical protein BMF94_3709 [Rhodotorula taiwanensis]|uniref:Uncharacterized protein n=1 Tax=Rhodotorula taiwanensis TaxID=741276 RepID=A0A2S5B9C4_9BASI|nr:hypothetical protein BMF94_3709 [Rhodotorula taiwanensis]